MEVMTMTFKKSILLLMLLTTSFCLAKERKLSRELDVTASKLANSQQQDSAEMVDVIIQFRPGAHFPTQVKKMLGLGARHRNSLDVIHGGLFRVPAGLLSTLE